MCILCIEYQKQKLTALEVYKHLGELKESIGEDHTAEVLDMIMDELTEESLEED